MSRGLGLVLLAALVAHGAGLRNGFVSDDHRFITANPRLATASPAELLLDPASQTAGSDRDVWRPLRALGHRLDLDGGLGAFGFHLHSLLAHLVAVALGYLLLQRLLPPPADAPALLGALALAVHPLGVEAVGFLSSRGDEYALVFGLGGLLAAVRHGEAGSRGAARGWLLAACASAFLACLGKESAASVPLVALLACRLLGRPRAAGVVALAVGVVGGLLLRQVALSGLSPVQTTPHGGDLFSQAGWALYGTGRTLLHIVWPASLSIDYVQDEWIEGWPIGLRPLTLLAVALVAVAWLVRRRAPVAALLLGWALLAWLPSSSLLVTLRSLVTDRGAYPVLLPRGALAGLPLAGRPRTAAAAGCALAGVLVPLAVVRTAAFHDDGSLWQSTLRVEPRSVRAHLGLARLLAGSDREAQGRELQAAVQAARPGSRLEAVALASWGDWLLRAAGRQEASVAVLERALRQLRLWRDRAWPAEEEAPTVASLAEALTLLGRHAEGDRLLIEALVEQPGTVPLHVQRAGLALWQWEHAHEPAALSTAAAAWQVAARLAPDDPVVLALGQRISASLKDAVGPLEPAAPAGSRGGS